MTAPSSAARDPLPPDWREAIDAIGRAIVAGEEVGVEQAIARWLPRLSDKVAEQRTALGRCHTWIGSLALRRGEHLAAMRAFAQAVMQLPPDVSAFHHVHARTQLAAAMSSLGLHTEGLSTAAQAADFGIAHGLHKEAAQALMVVGVCAILLGDPLLGERYARDALSIGMTEGIEPVVRFATINLVYAASALAEQQRERGDEPQARQTLWRAAGYVHRGERLGFPAGSFEHTLFRSNGARWLALQGEVDAAADAWMEAATLAKARGWVEIERHATFGLGQLEAARGRNDAARAWFARCVDVGTTHDAYGILESAYSHLAELADAAGDAPAARRHRLSAELQRRHGHDRRLRATTALHDLDENLLVALEGFDRRHLDAALIRLHRKSTLVSPDGPG